MSGRVTFYESPRELSVRVACAPANLNGVLSALATGGCVYLLGVRFLHPDILIAVLAVLVCASFLIGRRRRTYSLRVTNVDLLCSGTSGMGMRRGVSRADIRWLEFREDGGMDSDQRQGLYAVRRLGSVCLLPELNAHEAALVIERIMEKFPDFRRQCEQESPFGEHFTLLNIDRP